MGVIVNVNLYTKNGNDYIEIEVPPYPVAISCKGSYYFRSGSTNQRVSGPELENFILQRRGVNWESLPLLQLTMDDIDDSVINFFKEKAAEKGRLEKEILNETKEQLIERLYLKNGEHLTQAAALLFTSNPENGPSESMTIPSFLRILKYVFNILNPLSSDCGCSAQLNALIPNPE